MNCLKKWTPFDSESISNVMNPERTFKTLKLFQFHIISSHTVEVINSNSISWQNVCQPRKQQKKSRASEGNTSTNGNE